MSVRRRLSPHRRQAARTLLQGAKSLVTGRPTGGPTGGPTARPAAREIPGRWIRDIPETPPVEIADLTGTDPVEAALVRTGWQLVEAYERLSTPGARTVFARDLDAWYVHAEQTLVPLTPPSQYPRMSEVAESRNNKVRYRRVLDFARSGDRIFDIGTGPGYLAGLLLRDRDIARYRGIDVNEGPVALGPKTLAANGLGDRDAGFEVGDLYTLTPADLAEVDLVTCCEVMEHLPDPELGLRTIADALPPGAEVLFSVPLHGRLEAVWGHGTVFDVARLRQMVAAAGLYVHHVEPLANTWTFVLASRDAAPSARVRELRRRDPQVPTAAPLTLHRDFVDVPADAVTAAGAAVLVPGHPVPRGMTACQLSAGRGGLSFPVAGLEAVRLWIEAVDLEHLTRMDVHGFAGTEQVATWGWNNVVPGRAAGLIRVALRPGESELRFRGGSHRGSARADRVELIAEVATGRRITFAAKIAYLP